MGAQYASPGLASDDLTVGIIVDISEAIKMLDPEQLPLLNGLGADGDTVITQDTADQVKVQWQDDTHVAPRSHVDGDVLIGGTTISVTAGDGYKFQAGDVIVVRTDGQTSDDELIYVDSVSTDDLTVTRGYAGTATALNDGDLIEIVGRAVAEGSTPKTFRATDRTMRHNFTQIFGPHGIMMTGTARAVARYGVPDEWAYQLMKLMYEAAQEREQAYMYGRRTQSNDVRTMGGLVEYITDNIGTGTSFTVAAVQTQLQACFNAGGTPDRLIVNPNATTDVHDLSDTDIVRTTLDDARRGRVRVEWLQTEFGDLPLVRSRWCSSNDAFGIRRDGVTRKVLRPDQYELLGKTGDRDQGQMLCEETLQVEGAQHMFRLSGLQYADSAGLHY